jgi:hypothetical protein
LVLLVLSFIGSSCMSSKALRDLLLCARIEPAVVDTATMAPFEAAQERRKQMCCPLCSAPLVDQSLADHLDACSQNTTSCPHCLEGVAIAELEEHVLDCSSNVRSCYVCHGRIPCSLLAEHLQTCGRGKVIRMFHGTSLAAARSILQEGFRVSTKGLLGSGVYVTKDPEKAKMYGPVIVECDVHVGVVAVINKRHHNVQKCWAAHGFDSAWIPPHSSTVASGLEEHCVADSRRVVPISLTSAMVNHRRP